ncbi:CRTAC1 family protein [Opitutaceae bacterium EW11]|nr:CRTAC1 family protein [Opitutaceae bacterium EW11]
MSNEPEELAQADDAIIGRAAKWSAFAALIAVAAVGALYGLLHRPKPKPAERVTALVAPQKPAPPLAIVPVARFTDVTAAAGIDFVHTSGAYGEKLLPESMGAGVAFLDFDGDGAQDLLFVNGTFWPGHAAADRSAPTAALYHNDGHGHFTNVTRGSGLDISFYGTGVAVGDYDNDGRPDVFISGVNGNHLFHNDDGAHFHEVAAGVGGSGHDWCASSAWVDYDRDGRLDLFVCNYVRWTPEIDREVGATLVGVGRTYGQPLNFGGTFCYLYHNEGNGTFRDVSAAAGIQIRNPATQVPVGKSLGVAPIDLDGDGWIDLVVANDGVQNFVFHNQRDGTFAEIGADNGAGYDSYGRARGGMGIDAACFRNDAAIGVAIGNFATEMTALYVTQDKPLTFEDEAITEGIGPAGWRLLKFGVFFFDYDLDGRLDVLTADGHLEQEIGTIQQGQTYRQPAQLFWNAGSRDGGCFVPVPQEKAGADLFRPLVGRGSAFGDIDGDGDLDVVITQVDGPPLLLRNDQELQHHFLRLKLVGRQSNRDAIGAWIRVRLGTQILGRQVMPTRSYLSQSELPVTIGLGSSTPADVEITWPSGQTSHVDAPPLDRLVTIQEPPPPH